MECNLEMLSSYVNLLPVDSSKHVSNKPRPAIIAVVKVVMSLYPSFECEKVSGPL